MGRLNLRDERRKRSIPVLEYKPNGAAKGLILFSVGFGGTWESYAFLARAWSAAGYRTVVVEHVGSNLEVLKSIQTPGQRHSELALRVAEKARDPQEMVDRPLDLRFVWEHLQSNLPVGLGGHSFGSYTAAAALGAPVMIRGAARMRFKPVGPVRGLLLMSPQPPGSMVADFSGLQVPTMVMTGTRDSGMPAGIDYRDRLRVADELPNGRLELLDGADHMVFAGVGLSAHRFTDVIVQRTLDFWREVFSPEVGP